MDVLRHPWIAAAAKRLVQAASPDASSALIPAQPTVQLVSFINRDKHFVVLADGACYVNAYLSDAAIAHIEGHRDHRNLFQMKGSLLLLTQWRFVFGALGQLPAAALETAGAWSELFPLTRPELHIRVDHVEFSGGDDLEIIGGNLHNIRSDAALAAELDLAPIGRLADRVASRQAGDALLQRPDAFADLIAEAKSRRAAAMTVAGEALLDAALQGLSKLPASVRVMHEAAVPVTVSSVNDDNNNADDDGDEEDEARADAKHKALVAAPPLHLTPRAPRAAAAAARITPRPMSAAAVAPMPVRAAVVATPVSSVVRATGSPPPTSMRIARPAEPPLSASSVRPAFTQADDDDNDGEATPPVAAAREEAPASALRRPDAAASKSAKTVTFTQLQDESEDDAVSQSTAATVTVLPAVVPAATQSAEDVALPTTRKTKAMRRPRDDAPFTQAADDDDVSETDDVATMQPVCDPPAQPPTQISDATPPLAAHPGTQASSVGKENRKAGADDDVVVVSLAPPVGLSLGADCRVSSLSDTGSAKRAGVALGDLVLACGDALTFDGMRAALSTARRPVAVRLKRGGAVEGHGGANNTTAPASVVAHPLEGEVFVREFGKLKYRGIVVGRGQAGAVHVRYNDGFEEDVDEKLVARLLAQAVPIRAVALPAAPPFSKQDDDALLDFADACELMGDADPTSLALWQSAVRDEGLLDHRFAPEHLLSRFLALKRGPENAKAATDDDAVSQDDIAHDDAGGFAAKDDGKILAYAEMCLANGTEPDREVWQFVVAKHNFLKGRFSADALVARLAALRKKQVGPAPSTNKASPNKADAAKATASKPSSAAAVVKAKAASPPSLKLTQPAKRLRPNLDFMM